MDTEPQTEEELEKESDEEEDETEAKLKKTSRLWVGGVFGALVIALCAGGYLYYGYSPAPAMPALGATIQRQTITVGDRERSYLAYVPANLAPGAPLVIVLHGSMMNGERMRKWTGYEFDRLADQQGFAVVYPNGYKGNWNDCRRTAPTPAKKENIDDMGFMKALIDRFQSQHGIAADKVYAFGYSNGAQMAFRMAFQSPSMTNAIAAVAANLPDASNNACPTDGATARVMLVDGTDDPINPYIGGEVTLFGFASRGMVLSARDTTDAIMKRNGLTGEPTVTTLPHQSAADPTSVELHSWSRDGHPILDQYIVNKGGHVIPQPAFRYPRLVGLTTLDLDSPTQAMAFFQNR